MNEQESDGNVEKKKIVIKDLKPNKDPKAGYGSGDGSSPPPDSNTPDDPYSYP